MNDHELTVMVDAAASGAVDAQAALHGSAPWADLDPMSKIAAKEAALPFIFHGSKALADLGYIKPRMVVSIEECEALADGAVILTRGGIVFRKYVGWFGEGVDAWIRCTWGQNDPLTTESFGYHDYAHFPATVIHEAA